MCGDHSHDGAPLDHSHGPKRIFYPHTHPRSRRAFLGNLGKGAVAVAVVSPALLAACSLSGDTPADSSVAVSTEPTLEPQPTSTTAPTVGVEPQTPTPAPSTPIEAADTPAPTAADDGLEPVTWARSQLGSVSAYVLARGNTAAIVDTGNPGSAAAIGETLATLGLNYSDVAHVILTHKHSDHAGSIGEVLAEAVNATAYAGEADLSSITGDIVGLTGGEDIFGFEMLPTPGHTAGHMAAIDHQAGLLVAGDAVWTESGGVIEGPARYTANVRESRTTVAALAALTFNTLLVGHGDPIESAADSAVAALAASL